MSLSHLFRQARGLPPHVALSRGLAYARRTLGGEATRVALSGRETFPPAKAEPLARRVPAIEAVLLAPQAAPLAGVTALYLDGRYDLLGSGWGRMLRPAGMDPVADLNRGNRARAAAIRKLIDDPAASALDWHRDARSGHRWSPATPAPAVRYGHEPGVDIKGPWELARLQHLPQLALAWVAARAGLDAFAAPETYRRAFRDQVLDFWAANPPGFGVHWRVTMEVAIRAANILLAYDLFRRHDAPFDDPFRAELGALLRAHGRHIRAHPELDKPHRGNHYLANVVGLLFLGAYLPDDPETLDWRAHALAEFAAESRRQFLDDGANFEASTGYHRLSAEMLAHGTALTLALGGDLDGDAVRRLHRAAGFSRDVTRPDGTAHQVGDTDSGRLFRLAPDYLRLSLAEARDRYANLTAPGGSPDDRPNDDRTDDAPHWDENVLDHRGLVGAVNGLFEDPELRAFAGPAARLEGRIVSALAEGRRLSVPRRPPATAVPPAGMAPEGAPFEEREVVIALPDPTLTEGLERRAYPDFGLYIWHSDHLYLAVRCGPVGQMGAGGHAHNDQLAIELQVEGKDWLADPGTLTYTADTAVRERYRSVRAHAAPHWDDREPVRRNLGLFRLDDAARARCLRFDDTGFHGVHWGFGQPCYRTVAIESGHIVVRDGLGGTHPSDQAGRMAHGHRPPGHPRRLRHGTADLLAGVWEGAKGLDQVLDGHAQGRGDGGQGLGRSGLAAGLDFAEVGLGNPGGFGKAGQRHVPVLAEDQDGHHPGGQVPRHGGRKRFLAPRGQEGGMGLGILHGVHQGLVVGPGQGHRPGIATDGLDGTQDAVHL